MKLSKIGICMACFPADFLQFSSTAVKICLLGDRLGACHSILEISGILLKFPKILRS